MQYDQVLNWSTHLRLRENVLSERNHKAKKEHSKLFERKSVIQSSSREELSTSHMIAGKDRINRGYFNHGESIQEKGIKLPMHNLRFQRRRKVFCLRTCIWDNTSFKAVKRKLVLPPLVLIGSTRIHKEHDIDHDLPNKKRSRSYQLLVLIGLKQQGIVIGDERKRGSRRNEDECDIGEEVDAIVVQKDKRLGPTDKIVSRINNFMEQFQGILDSST
ncbi:hypothetical protein H5410_061794 [Solanum commersonii]|uniref:Uncharacterized protein n=1 Tax=Solanum commersonii TaxID=4109 RepID=A0A9J5W9V1_SOLCO|nr:hypothetical protein H5410_061794 [Solanum commersonii]